MIDKNDEFIMFLNETAHESNSTYDTIDVFKHRYGDSYVIALANTLMDVMCAYAPKPRKTAKSKKYAADFRKALKQRAEYERLKNKYGSALSA